MGVGSWLRGVLVAGPPYERPAHPWGQWALPGSSLLQGAGVQRAWPALLPCGEGEELTGYRCASPRPGPLNQMLHGP